MLNLFHSLFHGDEEADRYPESLVEAAIERAVDGTDPWLRGLSGYRKKLRPSVLTAMNHVVALVDGLALPRPASREGYDRDPLLQAMFLSPEQLQQVLHAQLAVQPDAGRATCALLVADLELRNTFGVDMLGDTIVRDVPQVTVSFANHRLFDPAGSEGETRRLLKRRAFDHLLSLALKRMTAARELREELGNRHTLLHAKLENLQHGSWGFDHGGAEEPATMAEVEAKHADIEARLQQLGGGDDQSLEVALELLVDVLSRPQEHLWRERQTLIVDRMGIKRPAASAQAPELTLQMLHNAEGRKLVMTLVELSLQQNNPAPLP